MKISYVEMCGFRGFRTRTRIEVPSGFLVVGGSNGSGKSTICDAIEYALTGSIRRGTEHKERGESIQEYLWWRGGQSAQPTYVEIGLLSEDGSRTAIRRGPAGCVSTPPARLETLLLAPGSDTADRLAQLCRTAILRDEEITSISVDLKEADRFAFVRGALGTADFGPVSERLHEVGRVLDASGETASRDYDRERTQAASLATRISQARADAAAASDVKPATSELARFTSIPETDLSALMSSASKKLAEHRRRAEGLSDCLRRISDVASQLAVVATQAQAARVADLESRLAVADERAAAASTAAAAAAASLDQVRASAPANAALAQLLQYGTQVGLRGGRCPLCGTGRDEHEFAAHLLEARSELERQNQLVSQCARDLADSQLAAVQLKGEAERARRDLGAARELETALTQSLSAIYDEVRRWSVNPKPALMDTVAQVADVVEALRAEAERVEVAMRTVRASQAAVLALELEGELRVVQERLAAAERSRIKLATARAQAREAEATVRRLQGELVDEQLGAIAPLLVEIYERLRPHVDWRDVRYNLRGDVRRMLSLEVGEGLNPSFLFSSGQRRAVGLAFLLAIHLSRSWCKLDSLVLDDPVQHVDDYRALHLAEVLGSIRRTGRQVICTVEDPALVDLLARRLRSNEGDHGAVVRLRYEAGAGSAVAEMRDIGPFAQSVLVGRRAS